MTFFEKIIFKGPNGPMEIILSDPANTRLPVFDDVVTGIQVSETGRPVDPRDLPDRTTLARHLIQRSKIIKPGTPPLGSAHPPPGARLQETRPEEN